MGSQNPVRASDSAIVLPFCVGDDYDMTKRFFVLFGLMICAGAVSAEPLVDGDVEAGKTKSGQCAACHGPQGNMQSGQFPKLAGQGAPYIYEQLKLFKSGDRQNGVMAGQVAGMNDQDMKDLAAYFADQQTRPGAADVKVAPAGAAIYHGGDPENDIPSCAGCHGPSGLGNAAAKFPRLSGQSPQYVAAQLKAYRDGKRSGYRNATIMNGVAENLSDDDIQALASYVAGLGPMTDQSKGKEYGALMQNAGGPAAAAGAAGGDTGGDASGDGGDTSQADEQASDEESGKADAASKEEAGAAAGEDSSADDQATDSASGEQAESTGEDAPSDGDSSSSQDQPASDAAQNNDNSEDNADASADDSNTQ
ncbi:cytochrome c4 [Salinisphaera dokdonensis CL-ES53]|uniref:Cytochrome c4 n=2 Tax=Salinisphaera TaxID=180541 RepID=A0ABV2B105_9GAMM